MKAEERTSLLGALKCPTCGAYANHHYSPPLTFSMELICPRGHLWHVELYPEGLGDSLWVGEWRKEFYEKRQLWCAASELLDIAVRLVTIALGSVRVLMPLEKERLGLSRNELSFVGVADIAQYWWCAQKSLLAQRNMEPAFFEAYLSDRITYAVELGRAKELPIDAWRLLKIGDSITLSDVDELLRRATAVQLAEWRRQREMLRRTIKASIEELKAKRWHELGELLCRTPYPKALHEPGSLGELLEILFAEIYPTRRWNFQYRDLVVVGFQTA